MRRNWNTLPLLASLSVALLAPVLVLAADQKNTEPQPQKLVTINGQDINNMEVLAFNALRGDAPANTREAQIKLLNQLINTLILAQQAEKAGLDKKPNVKAALDMARMQVLAEAEMSHYLSQHPVTDEQIQAAYKKRYSGANLNEYKVRHILVQTKKEAEEIIKLLEQNNNDFAELAKAKSLDASKDNGGELGWIDRQQVVKPFGDAMVKLKKGEYTKEPVQSQFGWHVIKVDDIRQQKAPPLKEVKAQLVNELRQRQLAEYIGKLRKEAKIEIPGQKTTAGGKNKS
jgi:peptidyl-prolyl cis-trans isomerase C